MPYSYKFELLGKYTGIQVHKETSTQIYKYTSAQVHPQVHKHASTQVYKFTGVIIFNIPQGHTAALYTLYYTVLFIISFLTMEYWN